MRNGIEFINGDTFGCDVSRDIFKSRSLQNKSLFFRAGIVNLTPVLEDKFGSTSYCIYDASINENYKDITADQLIGDTRTFAINLYKPASIKILSIGDTADLGGKKVSMVNFDLIFQATKAGKAFSCRDQFTHNNLEALFSKTNKGWKLEHIEYKYQINVNGKCNLEEIRNKPITYNELPPSIFGHTCQAICSKGKDFKTECLKLPNETTNSCMGPVGNADGFKLYDGTPSSCMDLCTNGSKDINQALTHFDKDDINCLMKEANYANYIKCSGDAYSAQGHH